MVRRANVPRPLSTKWSAAKASAKWNAQRASKLHRCVTSPALFFERAVAFADQYPVLTGVDLTIESGEFVILRGPNGAGKTSLLRAAVGRLPLSSGTCGVFQHEWRTMSAQQRRKARELIGYVAHRPGLYGDLSTTEHLTLYSPKMSSSQDLLLNVEVREFIGLPDRRLSDPVRVLSAGEQRRVSIGLVARRQPQLWLLDEPHSGLDAQARRKIDELLGRSHERGATIVLTTHEVDVSCAASARVVVMDGGAVIEGRTSNVVA